MLIVLTVPFSICIIHLCSSVLEVIPDVAWLGIVYVQYLYDSNCLTLL